MESCIFCKIIERQQPARIVYEDDQVVAIEDISPQAPVHLLVMPRKHLTSLKEADSKDEPLLGRIFVVATQLARERRLDAKGYRAVVNTGPWGGQTVGHLHLHVMGGRAFHWPPG
jgi:histidine triad (HIT) family protein